MVKGYFPQVYFGSAIVLLLIWILFQCLVTLQMYCEIGVQ